MPDSTGRPTRDDIERLTEQLRRDPGSPLFVELGEFYLALCRPRDAIEVGARGLRADPANLAGRMMVGRAFAMMHKWKDAQAELLKVVKADRHSREGFRLLGEVLMRRADYDRALPVLQHAQNLDPSDPSVLSMLRRAREGRPLDPPDPIPTPLEPAGRRADFRAPAEALGEVAPAESVIQGLAMAAEPAGSDAASGSHSSGRVRPRVLPTGEKLDKGAASVALRRSAAVGEDYLNDLLTAGLLDVPNVRVKPQDQAVVPDKVWGRSSRGLFAVLFIMLFVGVGGGTGYYLWQQQLVATAVSSHLRAARAQMKAGTHRSLHEGMEEALAALRLQEGSGEATAVWAQLASVNLLLYGEPGAPTIERAVSAASRALDQDDPGAMELAVARACLALATIDQVDDDSTVAKLAQIRSDIAAATARFPSEPLFPWLEAVAALRAGQRDAARAALESADRGSDGPVAPRVTRADMLLDEGEFAEAFKIYDSVLQTAPGHPLALIGRSLSRSERSIEGAEAVADLNVGLAEPAGPRVQAWKALALAAAYRVLESYEDLAKVLTVEDPPAEPRFLARLAMGKLDLGEVSAALELRTSIRWASLEPQLHPQVAVLDAELFVATGQPGAAVATIEGLEGLAAHLVRGRALLDLGRESDAAAEFDAALEIAPDEREAQVWQQAARLRASKSGRRKAQDALVSLGRQSKNKDVRTIHGLALLATGQAAGARKLLEQSVVDLSVEYPNPLAYRALVELANFDLDAGDIGAADARIAQAIELNPAYIPARGIVGRVKLLQGDAVAALEQLELVVRAEMATGADELAYAEALLSAGRVGEDERTNAASALKRAANKGASAQELGKVQALLGDGLPGLGRTAPNPPRRRR
jgi:tetratricopeptide (TPR) repeat protein